MIYLSAQGAYWNEYGIFYFKIKLEWIQYFDSKIHQNQATLFFMKTMQNYF